MIRKTLQWIGGANPEILSKYGIEENRYIIGGVSALIPPTLAAYGMTLILHSMKDLSYDRAFLVGGALTFVVLLVIETLLLRVTKVPISLYERLRERVGKEAELDFEPFDENALIERSKGSIGSRRALDVLRLFVALTISSATSHIILELLYQDDIVDAKIGELTEDRDRLVTALDDDTSTKFGPWALTGDETRFDNLTSESAYELVHGEPYVSESSEVSGITAEIKVNKGKIETLDGDIKASKLLIEGYKAEVILETNGKNGNGRGCGPRCVVFKDLQVVEEGVRTTLEGKMQTAGEDLVGLQADLATANLMPEEVGAEALATVEAAWGDYAEKLKEITDSTDFDISEVGLSERVRLLFDVMFDNPYSGVFGVSMMAAFLLIDLVPYFAKRTHPTLHDAILLFESQEILGEVSEAHVVGAVGRKRERLELFRADPGEDSQEPSTDPGQAEEDTVVAADDVEESQPVLRPGEEYELVSDRRFAVDLANPIQPMGKSQVLRSRLVTEGSDETFALKRPVPGKDFDDTKLGIQKEIRNYQKFGTNSSHFVAVEDLDPTRGIIATDYLQRESIDRYLFGEPGVPHDGSRTPNHDVTARMITVWMLHMLLGLIEVWTKGYAFIDGHPSNVLIVGGVGGPVFNGDPDKAAPQNDGYLKFVDPASALVLGTPVDGVAARSAYLPPEYQKPQLLPTKVGDVYSVLGAISYFLATGSDPKYGRIRDSMKRGPLVPVRRLNELVPLPLADLIEEFLDPDPNKRVATQDTTNEGFIANLRKRIRNVQQAIDEQGDASTLVLRDNEPPVLLGLDDQEWMS